MKIKTDENIPTRVIGLLRENDQDVTTVRDEHLVGVSDRRLADVARNEGRILVTLDRGFANVRLYPPGTHPGIFAIHVREQRLSVVLTLVSMFLAEQVFEDFTGCNVVIEPGAIRTRRPSEG